MEIIFMQLKWTRLKNIGKYTCFSLSFDVKWCIQIHIFYYGDIGDILPCLYLS